jgi:hypothetical protein
VEKAFSGGGLGFDVRSAERLWRELNRTLMTRTVRIGLFQHINTSAHQQIKFSTPFVLFDIVLRCHPPPASEDDTSKLAAEGEKNLIFTQ